MDETLTSILTKFVTKTGGVRDAVLVSNEAELITEPIGKWDEESITGMAAAMIDLTDTTGENLGWSFLEQMWLQAGTNYFIGIRCDRETLLLIKAINNSTLGGLRMAINRTVKALRTALDSEFIIAQGEISPDSDREDFPNMEATERGEAMWRGRKYDPNGS